MVVESFLWTDRARNHLKIYVNKQNCCIWATENSLETQPVPLHPAKVITLGGFTSSFNLGPWFFQERMLYVLLPFPSLFSAMSAFCTVTSFQLFKNVDVCIGSFLCKMALLRTLKNSCEYLLKRHFLNPRIISRYILSACRPNHPILIHESSGYGANWKMLCSLFLLHT